MEQLSEVVQVVVYSMGYTAGKSSAKWAGSDNIVARPQILPHTNRYLVPGLSFEGGIFNEQQTTFVPICPHGGERSIWP